MAFQLYRGTDTQVSSYNGQEGELVYNLTNNSLHVFDGSTPGGFELPNAEAMKAQLLDGATSAYDTLKEIEDYINNNSGDVSSLLTDMANKAPKPTSSCGETEVLEWNGTAFACKNIGMKRVVNGSNIEFIFA
jgi:hypothetical protein